MTTEISTSEYREFVKIQRRIADLSVKAKKIADRSGLTRRQLAEKMGNSSPSTLQRIVNGAGYNVTVETLMRFAWACGYRVEVRFKKVESDVRSELEHEGRKPRYVGYGVKQVPGWPETSHPANTVMNLYIASKGVSITMPTPSGAQGGPPSRLPADSYLQTVGRGGHWSMAPAAILANSCMVPLGTTNADCDDLVN